MSADVVASARNSARVVDEPGGISASAGGVASAAWASVAGRGAPEAITTTERGDSRGVRKWVSTRYPLEGLGARRWAVAPPDPDTLVTILRDRP